MSDSIYHYAVTAQKPTCVSHSLAGNFTSPTDRNLIIGKCTLIEIHRITEEGVQPVLEVPIYGRIACMELFRPCAQSLSSSPSLSSSSSTASSSSSSSSGSSFATQQQQQDYLFLMTENYDTCILRYNSRTNEIETVAAGNVQEHRERVTENGIFALFDPLSKMVVLHLYQGSIKILPLTQLPALQQSSSSSNNNNSGGSGGYSTTSEAFNVRFEETDIFDIKFLETSDPSTSVLAVLYEDTKRSRHVKTYQVSIKSKDLLKGPWEQPNVDKGANILIPVSNPMGGVVIVGESTITYHDGVNFISSPLKTPALFRSYGKIDQTRYLLGDSDGLLYVLRLNATKTHKIVSLDIEKIGSTSISSSITYIDNGYTFIGSTYGDSQLIKLQDAKDDNGNMFEIFSTYTNLGSIVDFCVVDLEKQGQDQIVTCSGAFQNSTLRVIRNGIGIEEIASIDFSGINGVWSVQANGFDRYIILTFLGTTTALGFDQDEELGSVEISGLESGKQTVSCDNVLNEMFVQVTEASIRLISTDGLQLVDEWCSSDKILHASISPTQVIISTGGGKLFYFEIQNSKLVKVKETVMDHEIASLDIHPLGDNTRSTFCAVGMWTDYSIRLLTLPDLEQVQSYALPVEVLPRSLIFATFEGINYLLCGLGDGHLFSFRFDVESGKLSESKKVSLGTKPIRLTMFTSKDDIKNVFAASDRPTVIYSNNQKLLYSNVNLKDVNFMCPFNSEFFPNCFAIAREDSLMIGSIDEIQKLHIRTMQLGDQALRICYHESSQCLVVSATRFTNDVKSGIEKQSHYILLIDATSFEKIGEFALEKEEIGLSLLSTEFADDEKEYLVVGTAYVSPEEQQPKRGRILVFDIKPEEKQLTLISERDTKGAVNTLSEFNEGKLLAGVNGTIQCYKWSEADDGSKELGVEYQAKNRVFTVSLRSVGDFIVSADMMKSITVFNYKQQEGTMEEIARDNNFYWMSDIEVVDQDVTIGAENEYNIFTVRRNTTSENEEERRTLEVVGRYHVGDLINRFHHGSLVMNTAAKTTDNDDVDMSGKKDNGSKSTRDGKLEDILKPIIYATVSGAIGIIARLTKEQYDYFLQIQEAMNTVVKGVGFFKHEDYRAFKIAGRKEKANNFLDGDLIESFLDLRKERQRQVAAEVRNLTKNDEISSIDEIVRRIEELAVTLH